MTGTWRTLLAGMGARFQDRSGRTAVAGFAGVEQEVLAVRRALGLAPMTHVRVFRGVVDEALYPLDEVLTGPVSRLRFGRVLHTLLLDPDGQVAADAYVAIDDEDLWVLLECVADPKTVEALLDGVPLRDEEDRWAVLSLDGPRAWAPLRELLGPDVLGMPYLAIEPRTLAGTEVRVIRAGKTGEFGYWVLVPEEAAAATLEALRQAAKDPAMALYGTEALDLLKLDGRFFNVHQEGARVRDPLPLGLQWMIDFQKDRFTGREALMGRRESGVATKVVGVALDPGNRGLAPGQAVLLEGEPVGTVVVAGRSPVLQRDLGLAEVRRPFAWAGLPIEVRDGDQVQRGQTLTMPPFLPESLKIRLDEV
ncbi:MAG TPA: glycine cleavage T C-terminal barrel domain-containing protein [Myxococcota bacterium]|nr:glycine cleavage T C-terminal barrel domain-containing protein [Myxococcota bacterium]HQK50660.1 glycine cleavage T C-terminal barrel domain-containing protein [Myxococcota bacterium]